MRQTTERSPQGERSESINAPAHWSFAQAGGRSKAPEVRRTPGRCREPSPAGEFEPASLQKQNGHDIRLLQALKLPEAEIEKRVAAALRGEQERETGCQPVAWKGVAEAGTWPQHPEPASFFAKEPLIVAAVPHKVSKSSIFYPQSFTSRIGGSKMTGQRWEPKALIHPMPGTAPQSRPGYSQRARTRERETGCQPVAWKGVAEAGRAGSPHHVRKAAIRLKQ